jgi:hypothetical protein
MIVWNAASETSESVRPRAGLELGVEIGTHPVEAGQSVLVRYYVQGADGVPDVEGERQAVWVENRSSKSYWRAKLGPFRKGDRVEYTLEGSSPAGHATGSGGSFEVEPRLWIALLWHQHQPLYRDTAKLEPRGAYLRPWVRLHAIRDYYSMAALVAEQPPRSQGSCRLG